MMTFFGTITGLGFASGMVGLSLGVAAIVHCRKLDRLRERADTVELHTIRRRVPDTGTPKFTWKAKPEDRGTSSTSEALIRGSTDCAGGFQFRMIEGGSWEFKLYFEVPFDVPPCVLVSLGSFFQTTLSGIVLIEDVSENDFTLHVSGASLEYPPVIVTAFYYNVTSMRPS